ncbi:MAG: hypothetical protein V1651_03560 [Patescibacteria group bacterium]
MAFNDNMNVFHCGDGKEQERRERFLKAGGILSTKEKYILANDEVFIPSSIGWRKMGDNKFFIIGDLTTSSFCAEAELTVTSAFPEEEKWSGYNIKIIDEGGE